MVVATQCVMAVLWLFGIAVGAFTLNILWSLYTLSGRGFGEKLLKFIIQDHIHFAPGISALTTAILAFVAY
jgi:hypothetical protein